MIINQHDNHLCTNNEQQIKLECLQSFQISIRIWAYHDMYRLSSSKYAYMCTNVRFMHMYIFNISSAYNARGKFMMTHRIQHHNKQLLYLGTHQLNRKNKIISGRLYTCVDLQS